MLCCHVHHWRIILSSSFMESKRNEKLVRTYQSFATSFQIHRVCVVLESAFGYEDIISSCSCTFTRSFLVHGNCNRSLSLLLYTINLIICVLSSYIHTENHLNIVSHTIDDMNFPTVSKLYLMSNTHTIPTAFSCHSAAVEGNHQFQDRCTGSMATRRIQR